MKKIICFLLFGCFFNTAVSFGQTRNDTTYTDGYQNDYEEPSFVDKVVVGGNILPAYANGWYLDVSPVAGYRLTNSTIGCVGLTYSYRDVRNGYRNIDRVLSTYGGRAFVMQYFLPNFFAQVEMDYSFYRYHERNIFNQVVYQEVGKSPGFLIGGGYTEGDEQFSYNLSFMYDLLFNVNSTRTSPWVFRAGILVAL